LQAWYPGQNGGTAVADVLFGDYNPAGRLPVTFYHATADLPAFEDYSMANRTYRYFSGKPQFAFGHGLSFTQFKYGTPKLAQDTVAPDGTITLSVDITNSGERDGEEVVQVYAHERDATAPNLPHERLCSFQRVAIAKGQRATVSLKIPAEALRIWDTAKHAYIVNPGAYELRVGAASDDIRTTAVVQIAKPASVAPASSGLGTKA
jgi:beta-glucosidase